MRLIDFGLALCAKKKINKAAGTPYYFAPEVIEESYGTKADCWSLGVVLYTVVSGKMPFYSKNQTDLFNQISSGTFHFRHNAFKKVSEECKDLIT